MSEERDETVSDLIKKAWEHDEPAGWFEPLYARAKTGQMHVPWAKLQPHPLLVDWMQQHTESPNGQRALVIGCGLGDDAEFLAHMGYDVTAFDVSPSAIRWAKERFPQSVVHYLVADLLQPTADWKRAFDFVLEIYTTQALPHTMSTQVMRTVADFVAPNGKLLVICHAREPNESTKGIPWPLSRDDLANYLSFGLEAVEFADVVHNGLRLFRAVYLRPAE